MTWPRTADHPNEVAAILARGLEEFPKTLRVLRGVESDMSNPNPNPLPVPTPNPWPRPRWAYGEHIPGLEVALPPDLTAGRYFTATGTGRVCGERWLRGRLRWVCTRRADHTRRHAAGTGKVVVAVWP